MLFALLNERDLSPTLVVRECAIRREAPLSATILSIGMVDWQGAETVAIRDADSIAMPSQEWKRV